MIAAASSPFANVFPLINCVYSLTRSSGTREIILMSKDNGNTISNTFFCNTLTYPHKESRPCCQCTYYNCNIYKIVLYKKPLPSESDRHRCGFDQCDRYCCIPCNRCEFLSSIRSVFLEHLFQFRNCDRQKLNDNGRCNVWCNTQCKY